MSRYKFSASVPRKMYWSDEFGGQITCPACSALLESEHHTYVAATRLYGKMEFRIVGNTGGHFCEKCPVVVLARDVFEDSIALGAQTRDSVEYVVLGIVDLDAVPEDKRGLPFDDDTNPIPLVEFCKVSRKKSSPKPGTKQSKSRNRKRRRSKRR